MFSKIHVTLWGKNYLSFSRLFLILPLIFFLAYEAFSGGFLIKILMVFVLSIFLLEMARVSNKCFYDPIHLIFLNADFKYKILSIWIAEYFGVKFLLLVIFVAIGMMVTYNMAVVPWFFFIYTPVVTLQVCLSIVGNRIRLASVIYQWVLLMVCCFFIPVPVSVFFTEGLDFTTLNTKIVNLGAMHKKIIIGAGAIILISTFYLCFETIKKVCKDRPFINQDSFPRKMI